MKKFIISVILLTASILAFSQAKKPMLMVVPSDALCDKLGAMMELNGTKYPDYKKAMLNSDLLLVIGKINTLMSDRGFPLKDLQAAMKSMEQEAAETSVTTSKAGSAVMETPIDKLKKTAKADIIIQLTYSINQTGPKKSISYNMQGLDAYTDKQVAGAQGTGAPSFTAEIPLLLEEAVLANLDNFNAQLQKHFDDMFANGREITIKIKTFDTFGKQMEDDLADGKTVSEVIDAWLLKNCVNKRYGSPDISDNAMNIEQVRMPIYDENGKAIDARAFVRKLQKYLQDAPFNVSSKLMMKGLGQATLILGDK
ncbi:MAG: DUF6175 family protein [Cytophagales bacterium]|nr:DUF6175 family protein [Cytophagales bacterium]